MVGSGDDGRWGSFTPTLLRDMLRVGSGCVPDPDTTPTGESSADELEPSVVFTAHGTTNTIATARC
jgi:hypothetical protein